MKIGLNKYKVFRMVAGTYSKSYVDDGCNY